MAREITFHSDVCSYVGMWKIVFSLKLAARSCPIPIAHNIPTSSVYLYSTIHFASLKRILTIGTSASITIPATRAARVCRCFGRPNISSHVGFAATETAMRSPETSIIIIRQQHTVDLDYAKLLSVKTAAHLAPAINHLCLSFSPISHFGFCFGVDFVDFLFICIRLIVCRGRAYYT